MRPNSAVNGWPTAPAPLTSTCCAVNVTSSSAIPVASSNVIESTGRRRLDPRPCQAARPRATMTAPTVPTATSQPWISASRLDRRVIARPRQRRCGRATCDRGRRPVSPATARSFRRGSACRVATARSPRDGRTYRAACRSGRSTAALLACTMTDAYSSGSVTNETRRSGLELGFIMQKRVRIISSGALICSRTRSSSGAQHVRVAEHREHHDVGGSQPPDGRPPVVRGLKGEPDRPVGRTGRGRLLERCRHRLGRLGVVLLRHPASFSPSGPKIACPRCSTSPILKVGRHRRGHAPLRELEHRLDAPQFVVDGVAAAAVAVATGDRDGTAVDASGGACSSVRSARSSNHSMQSGQR